MQPKFNPDAMLTIQQVGDILSVSHDVVLRAIHEQRLVCYRLNARVFRVKASDLEAFMRSCLTKDADLASELLEEVATTK